MSGELVLSVTILDARGVAAPAPRAGGGGAAAGAALVVELSASPFASPPRLCALGARCDFSLGGAAAPVCVRARLLRRAAPPAGFLFGLVSRVLHRPPGAADEEELELGALEAPVEGASAAPGAAARWLPLSGGGGGGELLVLATLAPKGRGAPTGEAAPDYADASALLTMRVDALEGLRPAAHAADSPRRASLVMLAKGAVSAAKVAASAAATGSGADLYLVLTHGLQAFTSRVPAAAPGAASARRAVGSVCRTFVRHGEEGFVATATLYAHPPGAAADAGVALGRAYIPLQLVGDGRRHEVRVVLHPVGGSEAAAAVRRTRGTAWAGEGSLGLSDADHNALVQKMAALAVMPSPVRAHAAAAHAEGSIEGHAHESEALVYGGEPALGEPVAEPEAADAVGVLVMSIALEAKVAVEARFARAVLAQFDANGDGMIDEAEAAAMLAACSVELAPDALAELFATLSAAGAGADAAGARHVSGEALVKYLVEHGFAGRPMVMTLLNFLAQGPGGSGAATLAELSSVVSEGAKNSAGAGRLQIHEGGRILVDELGLVCIERSTGLLVAEHIPTYVKVAISLMYHSTVGKALTSSHAVRSALRALSVREGAFMDSIKSKAGIAPFVAAHKINMGDFARSDTSSYATFNEFFTRSLRAGARPVAAPGDEAVLVSPADCRLCAYPSVAEATGVWVKGEHFTLENLLGPANADAAAILRGGQMLIARLAPQDYHRCVGRPLRACTRGDLLF